MLCSTHLDLILADSSRPFWGPGNNGCRSLKLPPLEALYLSLLFGAGSLSLSVGNETAPAAPLIGSLRRMAEGDEIWGCPLMVSKKKGGCECTVCTAGGVAQACRGTAPTGAGVETFECGACENLLTVLDMIFTCERRADFCGGGV